MDAAIGGTLLLKTTEEAQTLLEEMAANNYQWSNEKSILKKAVGIHDVDSLIAIYAQVAALSNQIAALTTKGASPTIIFQMTRRRS